MSQKKIAERPLLTLPQILLLLGLLAALFFALDINRRAQAGEQVGVGQEALRQEINFEATRRVELQATLSYVQSDDYVADYARNEAGYILPGEVRVVPLPLEATPIPTEPPPPTPDPAQNAHPWQAWLRLLTDIPQPVR